MLWLVDLDARNIAVNKTDQKNSYSHGVYILIQEDTDNKQVKNNNKIVSHLSSHLILTTTQEANYSHFNCDLESYLKSQCYQVAELGLISDPSDSKTILTMQWVFFIAFDQDFKFHIYLCDYSVDVIFTQLDSTP